MADIFEGVVMDDRTNKMWLCLKALRDNGGVMDSELLFSPAYRSLAHKWASRLSELRAEYGYPISAAEKTGDNSYTWRLLDKSYVTEEERRVLGEPRRFYQGQGVLL